MPPLSTVAARPAVAGLADLLLPVEPHLAALREFLDREVLQFEPELQELAGYCLAHSGKRIRPLLVFYGGWDDSAEPFPALVQAAAVVELVHLATLVHDDILDSAELRHRAATATRLWGPEIAVLLGDALFSHALKLASDFPTVEVCRVVSQATRRVCAGEVLQNFQRGNPDLSAATYFRIIELKTAELFSVSARLGASLAGFAPSVVEAVTEYGLALGTAYQIFDDAADVWAREEQVGKTLGTDLAKGKLTLPWLLLFDRLPAGERQAWQQRLANHPPERAQLLPLLDRHGVPAALRRQFQDQLDRARAALLPHAGEPFAERLTDILAFVELQGLSVLPGEVDPAARS